MAKEHFERAIQQLGGPEVGDYWRALGCFADAFGLVERWLIEAVRRYGHIPPEPARIVMSGTRIDAAMDYMKRFIEMRPYQGDATELLDALKQLGILNKTRNDIFHSGRVSRPDPSDSGVVISNGPRAKTFNQIRQYTVTVDHLQQMIADTVHIVILLRVYSLPGERSKKYRSSPIVQGVLQWPWLYKQPQLLPPGHRPPRSRRARPRRRKSFEA